MLALSIVGIEPLHVEGYVDGTWSQLVFESEPYRGKPGSRKLYVEATGAGTYTETPPLDRKTGRASFKYLVGPDYTGIAYLFGDAAWQTPISNTVLFTIPL